MNLNTGPELPPLASLDPADGPSFWHVIDRAVTYQSGEAVLGPPAREVFAPLPYELLLPVVIESVQAQAEPQPDALLDNAVLNACRALRFATDRRWYAKLEAGLRTLPAAGRFGPLIEQAMTTVLQPRQASRNVPADLVQAFLADILARLRDLADGRPRPEPG